MRVQGAPALHTTASNQAPRRSKDKIRRKMIRVLFEGGPALTREDESPVARLLMHRDNSTLESRVSSLESRGATRYSLIPRPGWMKLRKWRKAIPKASTRLDASDSCLGKIDNENEREAKRNETRRDEAARSRYVTTPDRSLPRRVTPRYF